jgi:hypothetical protein
VTRPAPLPHPHRGWAHLCPHLHRDWARPCHVCTGAGLTPLPHLHRDGARPFHICTSNHRRSGPWVGTDRFAPKDSTASGFAFVQAMAHCRTIHSWLGRTALWTETYPVPAQILRVEQELGLRAGVLMPYPSQVPRWRTRPPARRLPTQFSAHKPHHRLPSAPPMPRCAAHEPFHWRS